MATNQNDDGGTKAPEEPHEECPGDGSLIGRKFRHKWMWVWVNGVWTKDVRCMVCDKVEHRG